MRFSLPTHNLPEYCADPNEKDIFFHETFGETCGETSSKKEESSSTASTSLDCDEDLKVLVPTRCYVRKKKKDILRATERTVSQSILEESHTSRQEDSEDYRK
ncbi:uncharacterized protein LOC123320398 [Coccinella septempunctata]|uniref:uncharacterized protein LOC123320398 n=1 Tax=Coccinella septempunctata TaxID=41139 RepID=UPI001D095892|nr:uncharacterized protein LOC123320398 [Coccinella septempunctata]